MKGRPRLRRRAAETEMDMKVQESKFITESRPLLLRLRDILTEEFDYASILAADSKARVYSVSRRNVSAGENETLASRGFVARAVRGGRWAEFSFNRLTEETLTQVPEQLRRLTREGAAARHCPVPREEEITFSAATEYATDPEEMGDEEILERLKALRDQGLADGELLDFQARFEYQKYTKLFLSKNRDMTQSVMWSAGVTLPIAARGDEIKTYYRGISMLGGAELLPRLEDGVEDGKRTALELLDSGPIEPGEYDCVCAPDVTGIIVHEAFGHGVEMDMFVKKRALAERYIGQYVASPLVTMYDGPANQTADYFFDDDGVKASNTLIIDKGVLKSGMSDLQSALTLGTPPTGNGRRQDFSRKAYTRMTNTWFAGGDGSVEDMIASIDRGFLLENAESGMEDPKNWGIQCMVNVAREIRNGRLTGRIFSPAVLTGYVPDLLKSISAMSPAPALCGTGFCGKGYKEFVKVSDGGPYIKARVRLG